MQVSLKDGFITGEYLYIIPFTKSLLIPSFSFSQGSNASLSPSRSTTGIDFYVKLNSSCPSSFNNN